MTIKQSIDDKILSLDLLHMSKREHMHLHAVNNVVQILMSKKYFDEHGLTFKKGE